MKALAKRERVGGKVIDLNLSKKGGGVFDLNSVFSLREEEAVIAAPLHKPELFHVLADILQPGDFGLLKHGYVWYVYEEISKQGKPIDIITVADELDKRKLPVTLEDITQLAGQCPILDNVETYAKAVRDSATRARILVAAAEQVTAALDKSKTLDSVIDDCNRLLFEATDQRSTDETTLSTAIHEYWDKLETLMNTQTIPGVLTGFIGLDMLLGGLYPGEITVLAGNEGMGKTSFLLSMVYQILMNDMRVAYFSLEMTREEIIRNLVSMATGISKSVLKSGQLSPEQFSTFVEASAKLSTRKLHIIDEFPSLTPIQLRRKLRKLTAESGVDLVVIDGLWLMESDEKSRDGRRQDVHNITRDLKAIAATFEIPILIAHQYNADQKTRSRKRKRPTLTDMAESAGVRRNVQVILGMYREDYFEPDKPLANMQTYVYVLKDRNGSEAQNKRTTFFYQKSHARYREQ